MTSSYGGPLRHEPLAVELHNTLYASSGERIDGVETPEGLRAWLDGIANRLPGAAQDTDASRHREFLALRTAVREALHAIVERQAVPAGALKVINEAAARAPTSPHARKHPHAGLQPETRYHTTDATDIALAVMATDAIALLTGPARKALRACGAPGCVLMFSKGHPRQTWCSVACGNRARQARHYQRSGHARR